jgi:biotin carboxylase
MTSHLPSLAESSEIETRLLATLKDKRILIVMGSYVGKRPMYERARELGAKLVVMDGPGHWTQAATAESLFEQYIEVDLYPSNTLADRAYQAIRKANLHFDGVATFEEFAGPLTSLLARGLGLPGHPFLSLAYCRDKTLTREVCIEAGIPSPRFYRIGSVEDIEVAAEQVGFPAVLKPVSGASSVATYRVDTLAALHQRYKQTMEAVREHLKSSDVHSADENELIWKNGFDMILEAFLDGEEFDVDCLLSEGEVVYAAVTRDLPQPHLREVGSQMPPAFPADKQDELIGFTAQVLQVLGFYYGAFHVEMKYTEQGPRLIGVNVCIGGPMHQLNRLVWGVDLVEQYLLSCLGLPIQPRKAIEPQTYILTSDLPSPRSGVIAHTNFLQPLDTHPHVIQKKVNVEVGQFVTGPESGVPDSLGEVMVFGNSVEAAEQIMAELLAMINLPLEST